MSAYPNIHCSGFPSPEFCTDLLSGETGRVSSSLEASLSRTRVYRLRKKDTAFAAAWDEAEDIATDSLGDEARRRAIEGVAEPLVSAGKRGARSTGRIPIDLASRTSRRTIDQRG